MFADIRQEEVIFARCGVVKKFVTCFDISFAETAPRNAGCGIAVMHWLANICPQYTHMLST
jgi:hypothetical protein